MSNLATITNNILADSGIDDINVIVSTGSYSNPAWITALAWTKITGAPTIVGGVTASSPLFSSGGATPNITIQQASGLQSGFLSSTDWTTFNSKQNALTNPVTGTGAAGRVAYWNGSGTITSDSLFQWNDFSKRLGIGRTPTVSLDVEGAGFFSGTVTASSIIKSGGTSSQYLMADGSVSTLTNPVTGTGTTNYLPKFTGASTIGNSQVFDNGTQVGIGTASPDSKLTVNGQVRVSDLTLQGFYQARTSDTAGAGVFGGNSFVLRNGATSEDLNFDVFNRSTFVWYTPVTIKNTGNLLVGTTTDNGARLQVSGDGVAFNFTTSNGLIGNINSSAANGGYVTWQTSGTTIADLGTAQQVFGAGGSDTFGINARGARSLILGTNNTARLTIASTGAATFSSSVTAGGNVLIPAGSGLAWVGDASRIMTPEDNVSGALIQTPGIIRLNAGGSERMRITSSGNVGIGTTNPDDYGAGYKMLSINGSTAGILQLRSNNAPIINIVGTSTSADFEAFLNKTIAFKTGTSTIDTRMLITSSGNIGIGTTSPSFQLHVNRAGNTGIFLSNTTGNSAGYLFAGGLDGLEIQSVDSSNSTAKKLNIQPYGGNVLIGTTTDVGARLYVDGAFRTGTLTAGTQTAAVDWRLGNARGGTATANALIRVQINGVLVDLIGNYV